MSFKPTTETVGKPKFECRPARILVALSACFLLLACSTPITNGTDPDGSHTSSGLAAGSLDSRRLPSLIVSASHDNGSPDTPRILASDRLVCVETEDLDSFEEDPGNPQTIHEASLLPLGHLSPQAASRAESLPVLATLGSMSRRF